MRQRVEKLRSSSGAGDRPDAAKVGTPSADVENHLKAVEGYFKEVSGF